LAILNAAMETRLALMVALGAVLAAAAPGQTADEYQVKAAYMYNFAKFIDWPAEAFDSAAQPMVFCVLGPTPLSRPLEETLAGKVLDQRPLVYRQLADSTHAGKCHVLFIGFADKKRLRQILDEVKLQHVLTVGEGEGFASEGGIVRFVVDAGKVRLEFNLDAAEDAKLRISSKLLGLAKIVRRAGK
jgi:hypothetical protein